MGSESLIAARVQTVRNGLRLRGIQWTVDANRTESAHASLDRIADVLREAAVVSEVERTGVLPDFQPLADALDALEWSST